MFLGLCTLADWIGSKEERLPFCSEPQDEYMDKTARKQANDAISAIRPELGKLREELVERRSEFSVLFEFAPNAIQLAAMETLPSEPLVIIESETGSGKTEAALSQFGLRDEAGLVDGLYFVLPIRDTATQLHGHVKHFVDLLFQGGNPLEPVLAAPGYLDAGGIAGHDIQNYEAWWDDHPDAVTKSRRAAKSAKRFLAAQVAVGIVDQAMMVALKVKHARMRATYLSRKMLVVDEVYVSDAYMRRLIRSLLDYHTWDWVAKPCSCRPSWDRRCGVMAFHRTLAL